MLSIQPLKAKHEEYYLRLCRYFADGVGEPPGVWFGGGVQSLGLSPEVMSSELRSLMSGYRPDDGLSTPVLD